jgi:hypothetical protein
MSAKTNHPLFLKQSSGHILNKALYERSMENISRFSLFNKIELNIHLKEVDNPEGTEKRREFIRSKSLGRLETIKVKDMFSHPGTKFELDEKSFSKYNYIGLNQLESSHISRHSANSCLNSNQNKKVKGSVNVASEVKSREHRRTNSLGRNKK